MTGKGVQETKYVQELTSASVSSVEALYICIPGALYSYVALHTYVCPYGASRGLRLTFYNGVSLNKTKLRVYNKVGVLCHTTAYSSTGGQYTLCVQVSGRGYT